MENETQHLNVSSISSLIYLNVWFLLGVLVVNHFYFELHITLIDSSPNAWYFIVRAGLFFITPIIVGVLVDFLGRKHFFLLRKYALILKLLVALIIVMLIYMTINIDRALLLALVSVLFLALNVFYIPANLSLSGYWKSKWLPLVMALLAISFYPFLIFESNISFIFQFLGLKWSLGVVILGVFHSGYVFKTHFKPINAQESLKKVSTSWGVVIWSAFILGLGNASLFSIYPKIYLMLNEPHGVSIHDALVFEKKLFLWVLVLLLPVGLITVKIGVSRLLKLNNTLMLGSVMAAILFPVYFYQLAIVTTLSLCFAVTVNLPVVFINLSEKQRGVGVGVFIGVSMSLSLLLTTLF